MPFSRNWLEPSEEAQKQGVCHTDGECRQMYSELDPELKQRAIAWFQTAYAMQIPQIANAIKEEGDKWIAPYHFSWGMSVRNNLRESGFGEQEFQIDNMDCIYRLLIEEAVTKR